MEEDSIDDYKYMLIKLDNVSPKPIQSLGTYVSLDAECVVAGSSDKNLRFLDADSLEEIARCAVNKKSVNCVAISDMSLDGDDPIIVTGGKDSFIQIWNPTSGSLEKNIELPTNEVRSLSIYQGSETYLLIGTKDAKVILWDVVKNTLVRVFEGHRASVHSVSISSSVMDIEQENDLDFLCIASGGADRTVRTWDINTGRKKKKFRHTRSISTMVVANKGIRPILATGGVERIIKLWDVDSGVLLRSLDGHLDQINTLSLWEGYQMLLISGSADHTLRIYDILSGECLCVLLGHSEAVLGCTIANYDDPIIVSCSEDLSLIQWDLKSILDDYFCTTGENLGARNDNPPYLPELNYVAPEELDKTVLTKEERKRIRKEQKKEKRLTNSMKYGTPRSSVIGSDNALSQKSEAELHSNKEQPEKNKRNVSGDYEDDDYYVGFTGFDKEDGTSSAPTPTSGPRPGSSSSKKIVPVTDSGAVVSARKASVSMVTGIMQSLGMHNNSVGIDPAGLVNNNTTTSSSSATVTSTSNAATTSSATAAHSISDAANMRLLANEATNKFKIAEVEKEIEIEKQKNEAAMKLSLRLKLKNKGKAQATNGSASIPEESTRTADTAATGITVEEEAEMHRVKAEKLRQHKMQENRRNQSMHIAKERSSQALQKRLDELAAKKKALRESGGAIAENSGSEDSGSEGESNE
uniref:Uncharacterized protein n=1 Tax=Spumella elongata TaxID=89044 RepID=A0A7S3GXW8_9STRA|mmetsp:Transcript_24925/g.42945  ORF Transcript_24925/g.42945 Transcript_24925/m.42945 type:complete len:695 (+) Transcript_24925:95-2179(+)|eukprot:CAMPEP_0185011622 /NCGR_PEP_ID=MMETSP1098-20130426/97873_1 /TAXON_ID=89044 /ORGANISM="Spumella elongata, Strain CCAP 955/1" /LENGTH=694 /DNA_ID=CAMNT_0027540649 /DNA_START=95 /DNA_END=2179 /DNA_ORIENTATION=-